MKVCEKCGQTFTRPANYSVGQWASRRFCSRTCGAKAPSRYSDPMERFEAHVIRGLPTLCWIWNGVITHHGYGQIRINGIPTLAHRLSYELHHHPIPEGFWVLHICDNRKCVNPNHLYLGTSIENNRDARERSRYPVGLAHHQSKLTPDAVQAIRSSTDTHTNLGRRFGVSRVTIANVRKGKVWRSA